MSCWRCPFFRKQSIFAEFPIFGKGVQWTSKRTCMPVENTLIPMESRQPYFGVRRGEPWKPPWIGFKGSFEIKRRAWLGEFWKGRPVHKPPHMSPEWKRVGFHGFMLMLFWCVSTRGNLHNRGLGQVSNRTCRQHIKFL